MSEIIADGKLPRLAIQPGVFYSTRAYGFDRCSITSPDKNTSTVNTTSADLTSRYIEVPILLSFRVNMSRNFQLQFDFGPYVEWGVFKLKYDYCL